MVSPAIFTKIIDSYLPEPHASLLNRIIFVISLKTSKVFYDELKIVGLLHLVVLSGINITMLASLITSITGFFSKGLSTMITILVIILFIIFVGPQAPLVRAGIMSILTSVAIIFGRKNIAIYSLFLSIIFIAVFYPTWLTSISFYLSYGATLGIMFFGQTQSKNVLISELKLSIAAQIFTAPIIFIFFKQISIISPLSNLLVAWIVPPLMVFGFLTALLGKINYLLGLAPAYICYGLLSYMIWVIKNLSMLPFIFIQF